jgi:hypothetical protein
VAAVHGVSAGFDGVVGETHSNAHAGVTGRNLTAGCVGVFGTGGQFAGQFQGDVVVTGRVLAGPAPVDLLAQITALQQNLAKINSQLETQVPPILPSPFSAPTLSPPDSSSASSGGSVMQLAVSGDGFNPSKPNANIVIVAQDKSNRQTFTANLAAGRLVGPSGSPPALFNYTGAVIATFYYVAATDGTSDPQSPDGQLWSNTVNFFYTG